MEAGDLVPGVATVRHLEVVGGFRRLGLLKQGSGIESIAKTKYLRINRFFIDFVMAFCFLTALGPVFLILAALEQA